MVSVICVEENYGGTNQNWFAFIYISDNPFVDQAGYGYGRK